MGLHYNTFRDYDPDTGRYIESDPIGLEGGINTYEYAESNPFSWIDFFGLQIAVPVPPIPPVGGYSGEQLPLPYIPSIPIGRVKPHGNSRNAPGGTCRAIPLDLRVGLIPTFMHWEDLLFFLPLRSQIYH